MPPPEIETPAASTDIPPADHAFWAPIEAVEPPPALDPDVQSALERLGPSPFPRSGFPFLGFLATVYDHVASHVRQNGCA